jgi:hypothetical protein
VEDRDEALVVKDGEELLDVEDGEKGLVVEDEKEMLKVEEGKEVLVVGDEEPEALMLTGDGIGRSL